MTVPDPPTQHGYRRTATFSELPLLTVLVAAAVVLVVGFQGGSATGDANDAHVRSEQMRELEQLLAAADRAPNSAQGEGMASLAAVEFASGRSDLAGADARELDTSCESNSARVRSGPGPVDVLSVGPYGHVVVPGWSGEGGTYGRGDRHGEWVALHGDGSVRERGNYVEGLRDGLWETFSPGGTLMTEVSFLADERHGDWRMYSSFGDLIGEATYQSDELNGRWTIWYSDGTVKERGLYVEGLREGTWEFFDDLGQSTLRSGLYRAGIRID